VHSQRDFELSLPERFVLRRQIGSGGMGVVYDAYDRKRRARVALKTLRHLDPQRLYSFKQEFRALQDLQHENLARLDELLEHEGEWFYVMEFIDGVDILSYVRASGQDVSEQPGFEPTMESDMVGVDDIVRSDKATRASPAATTRDAASVYDEGKLRACMRQLAQAVATLHTAGKVHRDIKPGNVLVDKSGRVVLIDFGLVTSRGEATSSSDRGGVAGTAAYMAPEQALAKVSPASDWYSFGLVLYEALVGTRAYKGSMLEMLMDKQQFSPPRPNVLVPDVAEDLEALCLELIQREPSMRPKAQRILERLGGVTGDQPTATFSTSSAVSQFVPFVGREAERALLRKAFENSLQGRPVVRFIHGASGMGKTELVRQFAREVLAEQPEAVILEGRCYERESVPYKAFDGIADRLSRYMDGLSDVEAAQLLPLRAGLLPSLFPILRRVEAIATAPFPRRGELDPQELRVRMFGAFRELMQKLSDRRPVVLCIDDFQWTDSDSLSLLSELLTEPEAPCVFLVATLRTRSGLQPALAEVQTMGGATVEHMRLGRLPRDDGEKLASLLLPGLGEGQRQRIKQIAKEADGHPLFIQELTRHVASDGPAEEPARLGDVLWTRVSRLPEQARHVLELISVAGAPVTRETVAYAARVPPQELTGLIGLLRVAHLSRAGGARETDMIETYHDRVRYAVLARLDEDRRVELHGRLAIALARAGADGTDPHQLVRHLQAAKKPDQAFRYAIDAATQAEGAMAFEHAVGLYRTALRLAPGDSEERHGLQIALGAALLNAGRGDEGAEVLLAAAETDDEDTRISCRCRAAERLFIGGHAGRGRVVLQQLLDELGERLPATTRQALLSLLWNRFILRVRGLRWRRRRAQDIPARQLTRIDILRTVATGLIMVDTIAGASFDSRALLAALRVGEEHRIGLSLAQQATYLATVGPRARKRSANLASQMHRIAARNDDGLLKAWASMSEGATAYFAGDLSASDEAFVQAESDFVEHTRGSTFEIGQTHLFQLFTLRHAGELNEMRHRAERFLRDARRRGDRYAETNLRRAIMPLWLAADDLEKAESELDSLGQIPEQASDYQVHTWYSMETMAELSLYQGEPELGLEVLEPVFKKMQRTFLVRIEIIKTISSWLHARLLLAAAANGRNAKKLRRKARRITRKLGRGATPYHRVPALLLWAALSAQGGHKRQAIDYLGQAMDSAIAANMQLHGAAACYFRGKLLGGDAGAGLIERAEQWLEEQGVVNKEQMLEIVAPGIVLRR